MAPLTLLGLMAGCERKETSRPPSPSDSYTPTETATTTHSDTDTAGRVDDSSTELPKFRMVRTSIAHSCGLTEEGGVLCWGAVKIPSILDAPDEDGFIDLALAGDAACAMRADGTLSCWGEQDYKPTGVVDGPNHGKQFAIIAGGPNHMCGVTLDQQLTCWGGENRSWFPMPEHDPAAYVKLSLADDTTCGEMENGGIRCIGVCAGSCRPPRVHRLDWDAAWDASGCGVLLDRQIECWGALSEPPPNGQFTQVKGGAGYCALAVDGSVACWNSVALSGASPAESDYVQIDVGSDYGCGVTDRGEVRCWGYNFWGQASPPPSGGG